MDHRRSTAELALAVFMVTAIIVSQLSGRARQRHLEALARQGDLERLYALSRSLLLSESGVTATSGIARLIADTFKLPSVGLYDHQTGAISWAGPVEEVPGLDDRLREVARRGVSLPDGSGVIVTAIRLGGSRSAALAMLAAILSDTVLHSIANLAAIGLERGARPCRRFARRSRRPSGELRATVLDALAHEFKTPLTSMKAAASDLLPSTTNPHDRELVAIIGEELDRLQALVTDAVQMLRIDAGDFVVHRDRHRVADIVARAGRKGGVAARWPLHCQSRPADLVVEADPDLLGLALRQLIDNAVKYSPSPVPDDRDRATGNRTVDLLVRNSGSVIPGARSGRSSSSVSIAAPRRGTCPARAWAWRSSSRSPARTKAT